TMVQRRAQVLRGSRLFCWLRRSTRRYSRSSTYGPFLRLRLMSDSSLAYEPVALGGAAADDEVGGGLLLVAGAAALGLDAGGAAGGAGALGAAGAAAEGVGVVWLGDAAGDGADAEVAGEAGLSEHAVGVIGVADLADGGAAVDGDHADFAGGEDEGG